MKKLYKVLIGFLVLLYIPLIIIVPYSINSGLTYVLNREYNSVILNIAIFFVTFVLVFLQIEFLDKMLSLDKVSRIIQNKNKLVAWCVFVPIVFLCSLGVLLNYNVISLINENIILNLQSTFETAMLKSVLMSISTLLFITAFLYLIIFIVYVIVNKFNKLLKKDVKIDYIKEEKKEGKNGK